MTAGYTHVYINRERFRKGVWPSRRASQKGYPRGCILIAGEIMKDPNSGKLVLFVFCTEALGPEPENMSAMKDSIGSLLRP